jgi:4-hydroxy-tetrahydrodipicolinate reductase
MIQVAIAGDGQLGRGVARALASRADIEVIGPAPRARIADALGSGADVVIIATATRLSDVADHIRTAVAAGSNVIVSAEECAYPWVVDRALADELDAAARARGVTILGGGLNPGFVFDALVLTLLGALESVRRIDVTRVVDLSGFGPTVAGRLGLGVSADEFAARVADGRILGHAGFPQSMHVVAAATGRRIERIDARLDAVLGADGRTRGIDQEYVAVSPDGDEWFRAVFRGDLDLAAAGLAPHDELRFIREHDDDLVCSLDPGIGSQAGSRAMISSSVDRVVAARPGWVTVAELPPAVPVATPVAAVP